MITFWTIPDIRRATADVGKHFFAPDTMRFFNSTILPTVDQGPGGIFFVTKECPPHNHPHFTVRYFRPKPGDIGTVQGCYGIPELSINEAPAVWDPHY